jgi:hypothetical protein
MNYIFYDHHQELQFDAQCLFLFGWGRDVGRRDIRAHDFEYTRLDVWVGDPLYMAISNYNILI